MPCRFSFLGSFLLLRQLLLMAFATMSWNSICRHSSPPVSHTLFRVASQITDTTMCKYQIDLAMGDKSILPIDTMSKHSIRTTKANCRPSHTHRWSISNFIYFQLWSQTSQVFVACNAGHHLVGLYFVRKTDMCIGNVRDLLNVYYLQQCTELRRLMMTVQCLHWKVEWL